MPPLPPSNDPQARPSPSPADPLLIRVLMRLVMVDRAEVAALLWSAAFFFFILTGYFMLRPVRDAFGIARGADKLPWLVTATLVAMILVNPLFSMLVSRLPRRVFIPIAFHFAALNLALFYGVFRIVGNEGHVRLGYVFFIWLSVFNLFATSIFWATMTDVFSTAQSKRLFGFIAAGGTLGTVAGSAVVGTLVKGVTAPGGSVLQVQPITMLILAIVPLEIGAFCFSRLSRRAAPGAAKAAIPKTKQVAGGALEGVKILAQSRYLQMIAMYVLIYSTTSTILYYELNRWIEQTFTDQAARVAAFASVDLISNIITLVSQMLLTSRSIRSLGVGMTMALVPIITLAGFIVMHRAPTFAVVKWFQIVRRSSHFIFDRPARETLYTVLDDDSKYKAKPFIDTFVYRGGDQVGIWMSAWLGKAGIAIGFVAVPLAAVWIGLSLVLGWMQKRRIADAS